MFSGFHKNKEPRKMDDARHVGVGEFYSAFSVVFAWHGGVTQSPVRYPIKEVQKMVDNDTI